MTRRRFEPSKARSGVERSTLSLASNPEREALVDEAMALFSRRYGRSFTREEAGQAMDRLVAFFALLHDWNCQPAGERPDFGLAA